MRQESLVPVPSRSVEKNRLLAALPGQDRRRLLAHCQQVELVFADVLYEPGEPVRHVYFPTESLDRKSVV